MRIVLGLCFAAAMVGLAIGLIAELGQTSGVMGSGEAREAVLVGDAVAALVLLALLIGTRRLSIR